MKAEAPARPEPLPCAFPHCALPGIHRVRLGPHNWTNVCTRHDVEIRTKEARDWLREAGLERRPGETTKDWTARTLKFLL